MDSPQLEITQIELRKNTGERGTRKWIANQSTVCDVTDCPLWKYELHAHLHFPGQDLTSEFPEAPHGQEFFSRPCVNVVGKLIK
jgi:predicted heme/steroid binding protein